MKRLFAIALIILSIFAITSSSAATAFTYANFDFNKEFYTQNYQYDKNSTDNKKVYLGGQATAITVDTRGVVFIGAIDIFTTNGNISTIKNSSIIINDTILSIQGETVADANDITRIINRAENKNKVLSMKIKRNGKIIDTVLEPQLDIVTGSYKAGLLVREESSGIGTITFIKQNGRFASLGHPIYESDNKTILEVASGSIYDIQINSVTKPSSKNAGQINGVIGSEKLGTIDKNTKFGVYGNANAKISDRLIEVMPRDKVKPGKAEIYSTIDGDTVQRFEIEIVKASKQNKPQEKGMVIKVTDKVLKAKTGGILQGMSGSPIVQNDKLVGAVTHVFVSNPTLGYGIYADFTLNI